MTLNSQNLLESEITGLASVAEQDTNPPLKPFIVAITSGVDTKTLDSLLKTASAFATDATDFGDTATCVMITLDIWKNDWGNKALKNLN